MADNQGSLPAQYAVSIRRLLRYGMVMTVLGLLSGILFQESAKKLSYEDVGAGLRLEAVLHLALVHGHLFVTGVLMPLGMGGALVLARRVGGVEMSAKSLRWLDGYLLFTAVTVALMLYKGYHVLLSVRWGATDLGEVDAAFFGGQVWVRHVVYGIAHAGMGISLGIFAIGLWRSLRTRTQGPPGPLGTRGLSETDRNH
jgi:hypothetical protein